MTRMSMLAVSQVHASSDCPSSVHWSDDVLERDLYIQTTSVTVLAMDGRRRWLDIQKLVSSLHIHKHLNFFSSEFCMSNVYIFFY